MSLKKKTYLLDCIFIFFISLLAQNSYSQSAKNYFHAIRTNDIQFNKNVNVLFEDSIGYLWVGTKTGLYRYDGNNITSFQQNVFNSNSIPNNSINSIVEDKNNNLWIGSESYLIYYNRSKNTFKGYYKNKTVTVFDTSSKNENIWAYLNNVGLIEINSTDIENIKIQEVNKNIPFINNITASNFLLDDFNRKWLGTTRRILILKY